MAGDNPMTDWVKVLIGTSIGASVGFVLGILSDLLKTNIKDWQSRRRMRRALYIELLEIYDAINTLLKVHNGKRFSDETVIKVVRSQRLDAYEHAKRNPDVFYCLKEAHAIDHAFGNLHSIKINMENVNADEIKELADGFLRYIQSALAMRRFKHRLMRSISPESLKDIEHDLTMRPDVEPDALPPPSKE
jgi:hypothetical protein